jgi:hypothetical protein
MKQKASEPQKANQDSDDDEQDIASIDSELAEYDP